MLLLALALVAVCAHATQGLQELQVDAMGRAGDAEAQARVLQAGGPGLLTLHIPFAGSLAPIWGNLALPPGSAAQPAQYKFCVYLESIAAGQALYNGPKPQENADSYAPILADGSFSFAGWFANYALDPVTPFIIGCVARRARAGALLQLWAPSHPRALAHHPRRSTPPR